MRRSSCKDLIDLYFCRLNNSFLFSFPYTLPWCPFRTHSGCLCTASSASKKRVPNSTASLFPGVLLCDAVGHVGGDGAHLRRTLHVEHLVVEVDVGTDLLQHGALGGPGQEQGLVDLQAPGPQGLEGPDAGAGGAARGLGRHRERAGLERRDRADS